MSQLSEAERWKAIAYYLADCHAATATVREHGPGVQCDDEGKGYIVNDEALAMTGEGYADFLAEGVVRPEDFRPFASYSAEGDCLEVILTNETFRAKYVDDTLTQYLGRETGDVVGVLIGGASRLIRGREAPGDAGEGGTQGS